MPVPSENPDPLADPRRVADLLLYRMSVITRSTSLPLVRIFEGEFGITRRHWHMLSLLVEHGAMPSSRLATLCWLDRPSISRAVSGLVQKGLITRRGSASHSRELEVTEAGQQLYESAMQRVGALNGELARTLSLAERQSLDGMLTRLQSCVADIAERAARTAPISGRNKRRG